MRQKINNFLLLNNNRIALIVPLLTLYFVNSFSIPLKSIYIATDSEAINENLRNDEKILIRHQRRGVQYRRTTKDSLSMSDFDDEFKDMVEAPILYGFAIEYSYEKRGIEYNENGVVHILENLRVRLRLYGQFAKDTYFKFSYFPGEASCSNEDYTSPISKVDLKGKNMGIVDINIPSRTETRNLYICLSNSSENADFEFQGEKNWKILKIESKLLPIWFHITLIVFLLVLSGLFSGLNLGLMSLNKTDLKIISNTGKPKERSYARRIAPVRNHGNFLLCCLLFSNVLVNASLTILVDDLTSGLIAIILSTLFIVLFGEICPQAICSRYGLAVGAKTIYITKFFMFVTFPLAYPISKLLDKILGEEIGSYYTRDRLKELLRVTKDYHGLETEELGFISGALDLKKKTVGDIMTRLDQFYMLPIDAILNFDTMADIEYRGYSRIPIYENEKSNIVSVLNVKQLTLLDPSDNIPLRTVINYYKNNMFYVFENTHLDFMFKAFKDGDRGHMAFVKKVNDEGPGDPYYETIGLVTMEDVLEELLQAEILDESDVGKLQSKSKLLNHLAIERPHKDPPYLAAVVKKQNIEIPSPLALAAALYISTSVEPFKRDKMSFGIIQRLLKSCVHFEKAPKLQLFDKKEQEKKAIYLYEMGKPSEYFAIILEGRVHVEVGTEKLTFEGGPFTYFGVEFLLSETPALTPVEGRRKSSVVSKRYTFIPDYSVKILTDVYFMRLKYKAYRAALLASDIERNYKDSDKESHNWEEEIEKVLGAVYDDEKEKLIAPTTPTLDAPDDHIIEEEQIERGSIS